MNEDDFKDTFIQVGNPLDRVLEGKIVECNIGLTLWRQLERPVIVDARGRLGSKVLGYIETIMERERWLKKT